MNNKVLNFEEFILESEQQKLDEGWKEALIAGAMSLAALRGIAQIPGEQELLKEPERKEYVEKAAKIEDNVTVNFGGEFKSGAYKFDQEKEESLEKKLGEIGQFIAKHQSNDIIIKIHASESQVKNRDIETGKPLPPGALAERRAQTTKDVIEIFLKNLKSKDILHGRYKIDVSTEIGKTPWKPGEDVNQEKFTKEQFVKVTLEVKSEDTVKTADYAAYALRGERMFKASNKHAIGDIFYVARETKDVRDAGNKDTGHEDLIFRTLAPEQEFAKSGKMYDGKTYLIPWEWMNKATTTNSLTDEQIDHILKNFEIK